MKLQETEHLGQAGDSLWLTAYADNGDVQWRARLRRNFYDHQSYAIAERWDGSAWQEAYRVLDLSTLSISKHSTNALERDWLPDAQGDAAMILKAAARAVGEPILR